MAVTRHLISILITSLLEPGHGDALLSEDLGVYLIVCVFLLNLSSLVHEQIEELFTLFLHVTLIVVNEERFHDELVKSV